MTIVFRVACEGEIVAVARIETRGVEWKETKEETHTGIEKSIPL
jgi:hypothetical protein